MKKAESKGAISNPANQLIEELRNEDIGKRINSVNNLPSIAQALGPERTRNELLPYLLELVDDEDSVLIQLVTILQQNSFLELVGGINYSQFLFPILENLSKSEENQIREKASQGLKQLISNMDIKKNEEYLIKLIKRLNDNKYYLTKEPVAILIPVIFKSISSENQQDLLNIFKTYVADQNPGVRKIVSQNLCQFVRLHPIVTEQQLISMIDPLIKDNQEYIRQFLIDVVFALIKTEIINSNSQYIANLIKQLSNDQSWRIKYYLCEKLGSAQMGISKENFQFFFLQDYIKYLSDPEAELRSIAASKINIVASQMKPDDIISSLVPLIKELVNDTQNYVRLALASSILGLCSLLGKKNTTDHILPLFLQLLKDDDCEIRITLFKKLNEITKVLGLDTLSQSVVPALTNLANDKNWRIRFSSIDIISFFAKELGKEFLNDKIILIFMQWVQDQVYQVREKAVECVKDLITFLGSAWMEINVLPKILQQLNSPNYLHRQTILFVISKISDQLNEEYLQKTILPIIIQLSKDKVPNVRMNVCKTLNKIQKSIKDKETIKKILQTLKEDSDSDVQYESNLIECF